MTCVGGGHKLARAGHSRFQAVLAATAPTPRLTKWQLQRSCGKRQEVTWEESQRGIQKGMPARTHRRLYIWNVLEGVRALEEAMLKQRVRVGD